MIPSNAAEWAIAWAAMIPAGIFAVYLITRSYHRPQLRHPIAGGTRRGHWLYTIRSSTPNPTVEILLEGGPHDGEIRRIHDQRPDTVPRSYTVHDNRGRYRSDPNGRIRYAGNGIWLVSYQWEEQQ